MAEVVTVLRAGDRRACGRSTGGFSVTRGSGFHPGEGVVVEIAGWYLLVGEGLPDALL